MSLEIQDLPIIVILTIGFAIAIVLTAIVITAIGRAMKKKEIAEVEEPLSERKQIITKTSGEHLNRFYQFSVYILLFEIVIVLFIFPLYGMAQFIKLADIWPFILAILTIAFTSIAIIDWSKLRTKRTVQKDMKRY